MSRTIGRILLIIALLIVGAVILLFIPLPTAAPPAAAPATNYDDALDKFAELQTADAAFELYPGCESQLLTHGQATDRAVVLFHGYRNCPLQFMQLAEELHAEGYNVLIPRMPQMGMTQANNQADADLTSAQMMAYTSDAVDILAGLGDELVAAGLSAGGSATSWAIQNRDEMDDAIIISPFFGPDFIPTALARPAARIFALLPNQFLWQDDELKEDVPNPPQVYPHNSTHAISSLVKFGFITRDGARRSDPAGDTVVSITNDADGAVDRDALWALLDTWQAQGLADPLKYEFPADLALDHDLIDPEHPQQQIDIVYPVVLDYFAQTAGEE